jgi:hypothetical protein
LSLLGIEAQKFSPLLVAVQTEESWPRVCHSVTGEWSVEWKHRDMIEPIRDSKQTHHECSAEYCRYANPLYQFILIY